MFGQPDSFVSDAVKAQLDAQISFFVHLSNQVLDGMQEMSKWNAQASKALFEQSLAGVQLYFGANSATRQVGEQAEDVTAETQSGITKIVDTVMPLHASDAIAEVAVPKAPVDITKVAEQQNDVLEKVAVKMSQTSERSGQSNSSKPAH
jgi:hypothetical protein